MVYLIVILLLTVADQAIKYLVNLQIAPADQVAVIDGFFYLVNRRNSGAAWSFLAGQSWGIYVLAAISLLASLVMIVIMLRTRVLWLKISLTIITGGSIGNFIDRVTQLSVTDYLDFHFGDYVFPTFNLADMLVVCGTILLCLVILKTPELLDGPTIAKDRPSGSGAPAAEASLAASGEPAAETSPNGSCLPTAAAGQSPVPGEPGEDPK